MRVRPEHVVEGPVRAGRQPVARTRARLAEESGFSLIELMVSIVLLGVLLSAFASVLMTSGQASITNERRVQATAYLTQLHEQLQSIPWDQAVLYVGELSPLTEIGVDLLADPPTFQGEPLAVIEDPDNSECEDPEEPECARRSFVPRPWQDDVEIDGREYEVFQVVTWDTSLGDGTAAKRFTTVVRWWVRGEPVEQRFESTRAATVAELDDRELPEIQSLLVSPGTVPLDGDGRSTVGVSVTVTFNRGLDGADVFFPTLVLNEEDELELYIDELTMSGVDLDGTRYRSYTVSIPSGTHLHPSGEHDIVVVGNDGLVPIVGRQTVTFEPEDTGSEEGEGEESHPVPTVKSVTAGPSTVEVGQNGEWVDKLCQDVTVDVRVDDLVGGAEPGSVTANYINITGAGADMSAATIISGTNDRFTLTFPRGSTSPWLPRAPGGGGGRVDVTDRFFITAQNPGSPASEVKESAQLTFTARTANGGNC